MMVDTSATDAERQRFLGNIRTEKARGRLASLARPIDNALGLLPRIGSREVLRLVEWLLLNKKSSSAGVSTG